MMRQDWIDMSGDLATTRQCELAGVSRATIYAHQKPKVACEDDLLLSRLIDEVKWTPLSRQFFSQFKLVPFSLATARRCPGFVLVFGIPFFN